MAIRVLGIRIDKLTKPQALQKVSEFLTDGKQHTIFTPNPEMLVDAQKDEYFRKVLNSGDLNVCDGVGLLIASRVRSASWRRVARDLSKEKNSGKPKNILISSDSGKKDPSSPFQGSLGMNRIPGTDFMLDICQLAAEQGRSVYLLGSGSDEVVKKTAETLQTKFPNLKIAGFHQGSQITDHGSHITYQNDDENDEILHNIILTAPDILFVAFGHGKQEKWIYENLKHLPSVKIAMGVGGAFDYISGKIKRAPLFLRKIGLEWMYRLFREPRRIGRIWKATISFSFRTAIEAVRNLSKN